VRRNLVRGEQEVRSTESQEDTVECESGCASGLLVGTWLWRSTAHSYCLSSYTFCLSALINGRWFSPSLASLICLSYVFPWVSARFVMSANLAISDSFVLGFHEIACCGVQRGVSEHLFETQLSAWGLHTVRRSSGSVRQRGRHRGHGSCWEGNSECCCTSVESRVVE
jgi:hypothetical protein